MSAKKKAVGYLRGRIVSYRLYQRQLDELEYFSAEVRKDLKGSSIAAKVGKVNRSDVLRLVIDWAYEEYTKRQKRRARRAKKS